MGTDGTGTVSRIARIGSVASITVVGGSVFVAGQPASAATLTVTTNNAAGAGSLKEAVDNASAGDVIVFAPGVVGEIDIGATTLSMGVDLTIAGPGSDVLTITNQDTSNLVYIYNVADITISGLTLDDAANDAIRSNAGGDLTLTDVVIDDARYQGISGTSIGSISITDSVITRSGNAGVYLAGSDEVTLNGVELSHNGADGLTSRYAAGPVAASNVTGVSNEGNSIEVYGTVYAPALDNGVTITDSTFDFDDEDSIDLYNVEGDVVVSDVTVAGGEAAIEADYIAGDFDISRVNVSDTFDAAIDLDDVAGDVGLTDVVLVNIFDAGVYIDDVGEVGTPGSVTVSGLTIEKASDRGIDLDRIVGPVTMTDVVIEQASDDDGIAMYDVVGDVSLTKISVSDSDGGFDIGYVEGALKIDEVVLTRIAEDKAIDVDAQNGNVAITNVTMTSVAEGIEVSFYSNDISGHHPGNALVTDVTATTLTEDDAVDIDSGPGSVSLARVTVESVYDGGVDIDSQSGDVTISDVTLDRAENGLEVSTYLSGDVTLTDVSVTSASDDEGIRLYKASGVGTPGDATIARATIVGSDRDGLTIIRFGAVDIDDVDIARSGENGLELRYLEGAVTIDDVTIDDSQGGGLKMTYTDGTVDLTAVTVSNSDQSSISVTYADAPVTATALEVTQSDNVGISLFRTDAVTLTDSTVSSADRNGVNARYVTQLNVRSTTIADNSTTSASGGAGILLYDTNATIENTTITDNSGPLTAAAVFRSGTSSVVMSDSIVAGNDGLDAFGDDASGGTLTVTDSLVDTGTGLGGSTIETSDPMLGPVQDNGGPTSTVKPLTGSPAIDAGSGAPGVATDQRGLPRINGAANDLGSVEVTAGSVEFSPAAVSVDEDAGTADVTIVRSGGQDGAATVDVATVAGTALSGTDFTAVDQTVAFADNQLSATVSVPIIDDADSEPNEQFTAMLSAPTVVALGSATDATIEIIDEDAVSAAVSPLPPARFADTRSAGETIDNVSEKTGKLAAGEQVTVQIAGRGGVPADAVGVVMNVTAIQAEGVGFVTAHGCVSPRPVTSSLNYTPGVNLGNEVISDLSADGEVCLYSSAAAHLTIDVVGYVDAASPLTTVTPGRVLDTRGSGSTVDGQQVGAGTTTAGGTTTLQIAGRAGVPADAVAVIANVTAINPSGNGYVTVSGCVSPTPTASSLNYVAGVTRGNELVVSLDADGEMCLFTSSAVHLAVDIVAYLPAGSNLSTVAPARLLDTRDTGVTVDTVSAGEGKLDAGEQYTLTVGGRAGVPANAKAAIVNVTAIAPESVGFVTVHPCLDPRPNSSSLNYVPGVNGGNEIIASLDANGRICLYTAASAHLAVDVVGYLS